MRGALLTQAFYARDALLVARDLVGCVIVRVRAGHEVALRITESEAYRHPGDSANHCRAGRTPRNEPMWGPPGHAYVYLCYGVHSLLNLVTGVEGEGAAVLIRSAELVSGSEVVRARRAIASGDAATLLAGPGKVGQALAVDPSTSGQQLFAPGPLEVRSGSPPEGLLVGRRVGVDFAEPADRDAPYRFADAGSRVVSQPRTLAPLWRFERSRGLWR